jgi:NAD(P)-dependent dehydrogenase (short-subunit alcohol dehydrogenase family)
MAGVEGRVALVTGAGRGIGRATVELLKSRGAHVMGVARSERELAALGIEYTVADLGAPEGCARAVEETLQRLGPIETLTAGTARDGRTGLRARGIHQLDGRRGCRARRQRL